MRITEEKFDYVRNIRTGCYMGFDNSCPYPHCKGCQIARMYPKLQRLENLINPVADYGFMICRGEPDAIILYDLAESATTVPKNFTAVFFDLEERLHRILVNAPIIYLDDAGKYHGLLLFGGTPLRYDLLPGQETTAEEIAVAAAREFMAKGGVLHG